MDNLSKEMTSSRPYFEEEETAPQSFFDRLWRF